MDPATEKKSLDYFVTSGDAHFIDKAPFQERTDGEEIKTRSGRKYFTKHMRTFPELYRSDVSINPSYTGLKTLPYYVVCRRRVLKKKKQITRQLNREIMHIVMMQNSALGSLRVDRIFSIGFPPEATHLPDFATMDERRRINEILREK